MLEQGSQVHYLSGLEQGSSWSYFYGLELGSLIFVFNRPWDALGSFVVKPYRVPYNTQN